jgi:hypothetical protein
MIASWQAVVRGLVRDENDNAGAVAVAENVKAATRENKVPWVIDAHSGKGEDQRDDADPMQALRGASGVAGSVDYILSLRYSGKPSSSRRRLSGKGRFVNLPPMVIDYDAETGVYTRVGVPESLTVEQLQALSVLVDKGGLTGLSMAAWVAASGIKERTLYRLSNQLAETHLVAKHRQGLAVVFLPTERGRALGFIPKGLTND